MLLKRGLTQRRKIKNKKKAKKTRKTRKTRKTIRRQKAGNYEIYTMDNYKGLPISSTGVYTTPTATQTYMSYKEDLERGGDSNMD
jgi:hypothetical protein